MDNESETLSVQDTIHIATKLRNGFLNEKSKVFNIGSQIATPNHLRHLMDMLPKSVHLLSETDLNGKDKMHFKSVEHIISPSIINNLFHVPNSNATNMFLKIIGMAIDSFINKDLTPNERIYKIAYAAFFLRIWKCWIKNQKHLTLLKNFVSSNVNTCVEINFHSLILGYRRFRENPDINPFKPWLWSSQPCEKHFRLARSMTSTFHTKINFDTTDFIGHTKKIQFLQKSMASLEKNHDFPREVHRKLGAGNQISRVEILDDTEIEEIVLQSKDDLLKDLEQFQIFDVPENCWKELHISINESDENNDDETIEEFSKGPSSSEIFAENEEDIIHVHPELLNDIKHLNLPDYESYNKDDDIMKKSPFCKVTCNNKTYTLRKSTLLWIISSEATKISNDRLQRFIGEKFKTNVNIIPESYYAIFYEEGWYLGRVIRKVEDKWQIKFLQRNISDYIWPSRNDIQDIDADFIFFGPVKLMGNHPFNITKELYGSIQKSYKTLKRKLLE